jgi:SAM-dependent methyltransferase
VSDSGFADHFSGHSADYAQFRPRYPEALFDWLAELASARRRAWDAGTGNGQAAVALARRFDEVIATDASANQVAHAQPHPRVLYRVAIAGESGLAPSSVDLVTIAQALHWFSLPLFWREVREALAPTGVVAAWSYRRARVSPELDPIIDHLYADVLGPWWPAERQLVEDGYRSIPFPFREVEAPPFAMSATWTLPDLMGYLGTWSAGRRYLEATGEDPIAMIRPALAVAWGEPQLPRPVQWPLVIRVGRRPPRWLRRSG